MWHWRLVWRGFKGEFGCGEVVWRGFEGGFGCDVVFSDLFRVVSCCCSVFAGIGVAGCGGDDGLVWFGFGGICCICWVIRCFLSYLFYYFGA